MIVVGLTGGIGSGKTTVAKMFETLKVPVYYSDQRAKDLMNTSLALKKGIQQLLGKEAYLDQKLNRTYIADKVFNDKALLQKLNALVHPEVKKDFVRWANDQITPYVMQEAAIIFENETHKNYDHIILVTATKKVRIKRVMERDGVTKKKVLARMAQQWGDMKKRKLSDFVIRNEDLEATYKKVYKIHNQILNTCH